MNKRILLIASLIIVVLSLAVACGKTEDKVSSSTNNTQQEQASSEQPTEASFTFKDTKGEHSLPNHPKNIATTVTYLTDHFISLGMTPTATVKSQNEDFPLYLKPYLNNVEIIGQQGKVSLEKLLSLEPDLIVTDTNSEEIYDSYTKIGPTAILNNGYVAPNWEEAFRATADAFDLKDKAEEVIKQYETQKTSAIEQIHPVAENKTLMVLRIRNDIRYYGDVDYAWLYDEFGFTRPSVFPVTSPESRYEVLSNEKLPEIDPDYILLINDNEELFSNMTDLPTWKNLKAVKNNQIYQVASDSWFGGYGPIAASSMLDDLTKLFGKK
jgi:iron complex transport system substrate-binding protein